MKPRSDWECIVWSMLAAEAIFIAAASIVVIAKLAIDCAINSL